MSLRAATFEDWRIVLAGAIDEDLYATSALRGVYGFREITDSYLANPVQDLVTSVVWTREDGRPLALVGLSWIGHHPGIVESWSFSTPFLRERMRRRDPHGAIAFSLACRTMLDNLMASGTVRRLFGWSWVGHSTSARWHRFLRYEEEGIVRGYGARGEDFRMFARVNEYAQPGGVAE